VSGGSYDYLHLKCAGELDAEDTNLIRMSDRLRRLNARKALADTELIRTKLREVDELIHNLAPVWRAVEWRDSGDYGDGEMHAEIDKYERRADGGTDT
jgi:hypothetical protein